MGTGTRSLYYYYFFSHFYTLQHDLVLSANAVFLVVVFLLLTLNPPVNSLSGSGTFALIRQLQMPGQKVGGA